MTLTVSDGTHTGSQTLTLPLGPILERDDPSFTMDVQEIFDRIGCTQSGCHGVEPRAGLDLRADGSRGNLVDVNATSEARVRVVPGDSRNSYLIIKLEGRQEVGARMPVTGGFLSAVDLANIKNWIDRGAKNN